MTQIVLPGLFDYGIELLNGPHESLYMQIMAFKVKSHRHILIYLTHITTMSYIWLSLFLHVGKVITE